MPDENQFYDLFFVYHPVDISIVRRIAAQLSAMGNACRFEEDDFSKSAVDVAALKEDVLRSHAVGVLLSPESAASQLCNELIQHAVNNSKRIVSLILDEDIQVEVHPAIADNPYVFFRERDDLAERVDELRGYLKVDHETRLHTELLVAADAWQRRGRRPSQLLPPERVAEARQWLAGGGTRQLKPSPLLVEFVHSSRRQRPASGPSFPRPRLIMAFLAFTVLALGFLLLRAALEANQTTRAAAAQTQAAGTQWAVTDAAATAARDNALSLVDSLAATSVVIGESVNQTAQAVAATATVAARAMETANAVATVARATEIYEQARDADAARLVDAAEAALDRGDAELALALAWVAKDALDNPKPAYRVLRRAASSSLTLEAVTALRFQPGGEHFALIADAGDAIRIYESATWKLTAELDDHAATISQLVYSPDGSRLISASSDGEIVMRAGENGAILKRLQGHTGAAAAVVFDPAGGRFYSAGDEPPLAAWDADSGEALATGAAPDGEGLLIDRLLVTADGGRVIGWATGAGKRVMLQWDASTLERLSADGEIVYLGHDPAGRYAYSGGRSLPAYPGDPNTGDLLIWDASVGEPVARLDEGFNWSPGDLTAPNDDLAFISFHDDVALLGVESSSGGRRAALVDLADGDFIRGYDNDLGRNLKSAAFLDRQSVLSLTRDNRVLLWSAADGGIIREIGGAGPGLVEISFNEAANTIAAWRDDGGLQLLRLNDSRGESLELLPEALPGAGISPSGQTLLLRGDAGTRLTSAETGEILQEIDAELVRPLGAFFAVWDGARVTLYDMESGGELHSWSGLWGDLKALHLAADGAWLLAVDEDEELWLIGRERDEPQMLDAGNAGPPSKVEFSRTGERMLSLHHNRAILWDLRSGGAMGEYDLNVESVVAVDAAFDAAGEGLVFFAQLANGLGSLTALTIPEQVVGHHTYVGVIAGGLSGDGSLLLLTLGEGGSRIVDTASGAVIHALPELAGGPSLWRHLPEPGLLVIAAGRELGIWDLQDGQLDQRSVHGSPIADFSVSDDGRLVLTRDANDDHRLWRVESPTELLRRIEAENPPRELSCAERVRYLVLPLCE
ncbi:MAG: toll/interleukin-1 receptor domain-containing protein [Chloroflexi bacterium]|nr:toll/interleukin-1 receptor domain-containing protein [Chloroflexota bacterium]